MGAPPATPSPSAPARSPASTPSARSPLPGAAALGAAATWAAVAAGCVWGSDTIVLQASELGFSLYADMGFRTVVPYTAFRS